MTYAQLSAMKPYRITKASSDRTFILEEIIWISASGDINCVRGAGVIMPNEVDNRTLDFTAEEALDYEVIKSQYSEICRPKDMNRNLP